VAVSARRAEWLVLIAGALLAWPIWSFRGAVHEPGEVVDASLTLITSDHDQLSCALQASFGKYRCEFPSPKHAWPDPPTPEEQLVPYYSVDSRLYLIPALFHQPALAARYVQEPPARIAIRQLRRFIARCKLRLVGEAVGVRARWLRNARWRSEPDGWVAEALSCELKDE
jgi:hypothetical protein